MIGQDGGNPADAARYCVLVDPPLDGIGCEQGGFTARGGEVYRDPQIEADHPLPLFTPMLALTTAKASIR